MQVQRSIEIMAPPEKIWPLLAEPQKILEWYFPLQKFEYTGDQKNSVGAPFYFEEKLPTGTMKLNCEVTEWVDNERFAFRMISGNMMKSYEEKWTVEATPSGGRFTFAEQGEIPGIFGTLFGRIAERGSAGTIDKMLKKLKSLAET
jgi:uncharacterized protein YndB with AHSA1/START domain